ncbi:MAG TPA: hypothetical protein VJK48_02755 [Chlamydiales bacterium]|nr:hypothetical protein [Chlamydiales bacterium]
MTRKEKIQKWWKIEGKLECLGALLTIIILIPYGNNPLVFGLITCTIALWCFGKIFFRKNQWQMLSLCGLWALYQGLTSLLAYFRTLH